MQSGFLRNVIIRADGNSEIGLGHVIRSCALARMLNNNGFKCQFIIKEPIQMLINEIRNSGSGMLALPAECTVDSELDAIFSSVKDARDIVVLDGYGFDEKFQIAIKSREIKLVCIDDIHAYHFVADVVINHSGGIDPKEYCTEPYTKLCLGPSFALLREAFLSARAKVGNDESILICMGGADPGNKTLEVLEKLLQSNASHKIHIVLGGGYQFEETLAETIRSLDLMDWVEIHKMLGANQLAELMAICSKAVTPPSTVAFEYLTVGGTLYLYQIAENQKDVKKYFLEAGLAFDFRDYPVTDLQLLKEVNSKAKSVFDRESAKRLTEVFKSL